MQKLIIFIATFITVLGVNSCKKETVVSDFESLGIGSYVTLVSSGNSRIDYANLSGSSVSITVKEFGSPVDKIKVYVTKGTADLDRAKWKSVKEFPYSGETALNVKATEIATALGIPPTGLEPGAVYTLYNQVITKDGRSFDVVNTHPDFAGISNYNMALTWSAVIVCPFVSTGFGGNFQVLEDKWADFSPGEVVTVATGPGANQISMTVYPKPGVGSNRVPIIVSIDPATGAATVALQAYGDYGGEVIKTTTVGTNNYVFSCVGTITLRLNHTGNSNYGDYNLLLKKL